MVMSTMITESAIKDTLGVNQTYEEFMEEFKKRLRYRLKGYSLDLLDAGLLRNGAALELRGWAVRPITQEVKEFSIRFDMTLGDESSEAIDELCTAICGELVKGMIRG